MFKLRNLISCFKYHIPINVKKSSVTSVYKEDKIKVAGFNLNYLKVGNGPHNILFLPGALGSIWTDFKPQIEAFDKTNFTIVVWDPPGYGKSRPPNKEFPVDFYEKDAEVAAQFMDALNIDKYSLLGWSGGGITSLLLATRYPKKINKLVLTATVSYILPGEVEAYESIKDLNKWSEKMRQPMMELYGKDYFPVLWGQWVDAIRNIYETRNGEICAYELRNITFPTLIVYGQQDPVVDKSHVTHLQKNIINSRVHLYPEGKHNAHLKYADDFNKRVQDFLLEE